MDKSTLALCGVDISAANYLHALSGEALRRGHGVVSMLNLTDTRMGLTLVRPYALVTGMSSAIVHYKSMDELNHGGSATDLLIPWFVVADTHGSWGRPPARGRVSGATVFTVSPLEVEQALEFGYGGAEFLGFPPSWENAQDITLSPFNDGMFAIYVGGIKSVPITLEMLAVVVEGARQSFQGRPWRLIFNPHPNAEKTDNEAEAAAWESEKSRILAGVELAPMPPGMTVNQVMSKVTLVCLTSGAGEVPPACIMRQSVAYYRSGSVDARMVKQIGTPSWLPVDESAVWRFDSVSGFRDVLSMADDPTERRALTARQERVYPRQTGGPTVRRILDRIEGALN